MQMGRAPAAPRRNALGQHLEHVVEGRTFEVPVRPSPTNEREELVFVDVFGGGDGDHLLCQDVERLV